MQTVECVAPELEYPLGVERQLADMERVADYIANHPAKMVTLLALTTFPVGEYVTGADLVKRLDALQEDEPGWRFRDAHTTPFSYCKNSFEPVGLVEFGHKKGTSGRMAETVRLTDRGWAIGVTVAGAFLSFELRASELVRDDDEYQVPSLQDVVGLSSRQRNQNRPPSRLLMYRELLGSPDGLSTTELGQRCGLVASTTVETIQELCRTGLLYQVDLLDPAGRRFKIGAPPPDLKSYLWRMHGDTKVAIETAVALYGQGVKEVTGDKILSAAQAARPDLSLKRTWKLFMRWVQQPDRASSFVTEIDARKDGVRSQVFIAEEYREYLTELLKVRQLLAGTTEEAADFRADAWARAREITGSKEQMTHLLARAKANSRINGAQGSNDWTLGIERHVPIEGISAIALHQIVMEASGRSVTYKKFRARLEGIEGLEIADWPGAGQRGKSLGYVSLRKTYFPPDWQAEARCAVNGEDPELFFPVGTEGPAILQADEAKRICGDCPVRLACLKAAIDEGEQFGVRGGVWFERQAEELPAERREAYRRIVTIGPPSPGAKAADPRPFCELA